MHWRISESNHQWPVKVTPWCTRHRVCIFDSEVVATEKLGSDVLGDCCRRNPAKVSFCLEFEDCDAHRIVWLRRVLIRHWSVASTHTLHPECKLLVTILHSPPKGNIHANAHKGCFFFLPNCLREQRLLTKRPLLSPWKPQHWPLLLSAFLSYLLPTHPG